VPTYGPVRTLSKNRPPLPTKKHRARKPPRAPPLANNDGKENEDQEYTGYLEKVKTLNHMKLSLKDMLTSEVREVTPRQKRELIAQIQQLEREIDAYEQGIFTH
jgi:hypothetical protein